LENIAVLIGLCLAAPPIVDWIWGIVGGAPFLTCLADPYIRALFRIAPYIVGVGAIVVLAISGFRSRAALLVLLLAAAVYSIRDPYAQILGLHCA